MIREATRSVWLSTYTLRDGRGELRDILLSQARNDVNVNLIVHPKPIAHGGHTDEVLDELHKGGVRVFVRKSHSKCVIIDEEDIMLGSANLCDIVGRELGVRLRSRSMARQLIEYLGALVS
jgi:phosphatidylserine/phosphatidylglycerophosphate/cardiolipin synthase-like enzyme